MDHAFKVQHGKISELVVDPSQRDGSRVPLRTCIPALQESEPCGGQTFPDHHKRVGTRIDSRRGLARHGERPRAPQRPGRLNRTNSDVCPVTNCAGITNDLDDRVWVAAS